MRWGLRSMYLTFPSLPFECAKISRPLLITDYSVIYEMVPEKYDIRDFQLPKENSTICLTGLPVPLEYAPTLLILVSSIYCKNKKRTENYFYCHRVNRVSVRVRLIVDQYDKRGRESLIGRQRKIPSVKKSQYLD